MTENGGASRRVAGRYRLERRIGRGGAGAVWRAHDERLDRPVAVKQIPITPDPITPDAQATSRARALREARVAARLRVPNVVQVYDVVEEDNNVYLVMELVDAPNLSSFVRKRGPLKPEEAAAVGLQVLDALQAAHRLGIVHRDVKPSNVLIDNETPRLTDFGIARLNDDTSLTATGIVMGTPAYIAPEQAQGKPVGPAMDLYGLGATLYFAVEGESPFQADGTLSTVLAVINEPPRPMTTTGPLRDLLLQLLSKDPKQRPDAAEVRRRLQEIAGRNGREPRRALLPSAPWVSNGGASGKTAGGAAGAQGVDAGAPTDARAKDAGAPADAPEADAPKADAQKTDGRQADLPEAEDREAAERKAGEQEAAEEGAGEQGAGEAAVGAAPASPGTVELQQATTEELDAAPRDHRSAADAAADARRSTAEAVPDTAEAVPDATDAAPAVAPSARDRGLVSPEVRRTTTAPLESAPPPAPPREPARQALRGVLVVLLLILGIAAIRGLGDSDTTTPTDDASVAAGGEDAAEPDADADAGDQQAQPDPDAEQGGEAEAAQPGDGEAQTTEGAEQSGEEAGGAQEPQPEGEQGDGVLPATDAEVPDDWVEYNPGDAPYRLRHPPDWEVVDRGGTLTDIRDPRTGMYLRLDWVHDRRDPVGAWEQAEPGFRSRHPGYERIRLEPTEYKGYRAALWEYRYREGGVTLHAYNLGVNADEYGFALNLQSRQRDWDEAQRLWPLFLSAYEFTGP